MITNLAAPFLPISSIEEFVKQALKRGHDRFLASSEQERVSVTIGGQTFAVAESETFLAPSIQHCLVSNQTKSSAQSDITLFLDYSGWHLETNAAALLVSHGNRLQLDRHFAELGIRASFGHDFRTWDIFDPVARIGVRLQPGKDAASPWEPSSPLTHFCNWIAELDHKTMVHAASLAKDGVGALLVGHGGAGKSGTVVSGLLLGFQSAGDDYTLISSDKGYRAHAVFRTVKQDIAGMKRLGLPPTEELNWQNKAVFRPETVGANAIVDEAPINVILSPSRGAEKTRFFPADPAEVFKTLSISTLKQIGGNTQDVFRACAALVRDVPCFTIALSSNKDEIGAELSRFLRNMPC